MVEVKLLYIDAAQGIFNHNHLIVKLMVLKQKFNDFALSVNNYMNVCGCELEY